MTHTRTDALEELVVTPEGVTRARPRANSTQGFTRVDPLAGMYPSYSPYNYVMNNPISNTDPTGMSVETEIYNRSGKKVGEDENGRDGNVAVVSVGTARQLRKGTVSAAQAIAGGDKTTRSVLGAILGVNKRGEANGGYREESSIVMNNGSVIEGETGTMPTIEDGESTAEAVLPNPPTGSTFDDIQASVHLHPLKAQEQNGKLYAYSADDPSLKDNRVFERYPSNVIVGPVGAVPRQAEPGKTILQTADSRSRGAVFYNRASQRQFSLPIGTIKRIMKH